MDTYIKALDYILVLVKDAIPLFFLGIAASFVHTYRIRSKKHFTKKEFLGLSVISSFVVYCTIIICKDYFNITSDIQYVIAGIAATFSIYILDLIEQIITILIPEAIRAGIKKFFGGKGSNDEE